MSLMDDDLVDGDEPETCWNCDGECYVDCEECEVGESVTCEWCELGAVECPVCMGEGVVLD